MIDRLLFLLILFGSQVSYAEVILHNRIVSSNSIGYRCDGVKDEFAKKVLSLIENIQPTKQTLDTNSFINNRLDFQGNCDEFLNEQYKLLYSLSVQNDGNSEAKLLESAIMILSRLYDVNPFNRRLTKILEETVDKDKEIYPYLSGVFVNK